MREIYNDFFGEFGGRFVAEVLRSPLDELEEAFIEAMGDADFIAEYKRLLRDYVGRPTPLLFAENLTRETGGADIYIKLEGLANTGAHKINNALGQALLAKRMGKTRIIAETGAGQHGVATAAVCAKLGLPCRVYMGEVDVRRQRPNVFWMELFGAEVMPVTSGAKTLKDAVNEAMRDWSASFADTHYLLGSALGPSPFPDMVREFQSVVGNEVRDQLAERGITPDALVTCVGGGSNAIGFFSPFIGDGGTNVGAPQDRDGGSAAGGGDAPGDASPGDASPGDGGGAAGDASPGDGGKHQPELIGVEAGGRGEGIGEHAARMTGLGREGIVQGYRSLFLLDDDGQVSDTHSVSAGLDYPGIGPQLAHLGQTGRIRFYRVGDETALEGLKRFARAEGVIFALESAHAGMVALEKAREIGPGGTVVINMSGRGDKDLFISARELQPEVWKDFLESEAASL